MTDVKFLRGQHIKEGDTRPPLRAQLLEAGSAFNLTDHTVNIRIRRTDDDTLLVDGGTTIESNNRGMVSYSWNDGETDIAGTYLAEFSAIDQSGEQITFPNGGYARIYIEEVLE